MQLSQPELDALVKQSAAALGQRMAELTAAEAARYTALGRQYPRDYPPSTLSERVHFEVESLLKKTPVLDLAGKDLSGADLHGSDLRYASLRDVNLIGANLAAANLSGADLSRAHLTGADLSDADLNEAKLVGAQLSGANLTRTNLPLYGGFRAYQGADFSDTNLTTLRDWGSGGHDWRKAHLVSQGAHVNVTEAEWLTCPLAGPLLSHVRDRLTPRKQVLLACGRGGGAGPSSDPYCQVAERFVDGKATLAELDLSQAALDRETKENPEVWDRFHSTRGDYVFAAQHLLAVARGEENILSIEQGEISCHPFDPRREAGELVREVFRNPFRPFVVDPAWLAWKKGAIPALARGIYQERAFDRMPLLATALQDAGCEDADAIAHCNGRGPHIRGCWVVDLLLGFL